MQPLVSIGLLFYYCHSNPKYLMLFLQEFIIPPFKVQHLFFKQLNFTTNEN